MAAEGWREKRFVPRGWSTVKSRRGLWVREWRLHLPKVIAIFQNSVHPTEFLIGVVKLQLSITSQMCHLGIIQREWWETEIVQLYVSNPLLRKHLSVFQSLICLVQKNWNQKKQFLQWFQERMYWSCCQLAFGKAWFSGVGSYERNNDRKASSVIVICQLQHIF